MKIIKYGVLIMLALGLSACSFNTEDSPIKDITDAVSETVTTTTGILDGAGEVFTYVQNTQSTFGEIMNLSGQWTEAFNAVTNGEMTNAELTSIVTNEILPANEDLMTQIKNFTPPNEATAIINDLLVNAVTTQHEALLSAINGIQIGDVSVLNSANQMISEIKGFEGQFTNMIQNIITEYGF